MRDILNQRYGSFKAIRKTNFSENGFVVWVLKCECGKKVKVSWLDIHHKRIPPCLNKDCWPSQRHKKQIATVKMWDRINAEKREKKFEENRIRWAKEKAAKRKRIEKEQGGYGPDDFDEWGDF